MNERQVTIFTMGLIGEYNHSIDAKGRLTIPYKLRAELGNEFFMTRSMDGCLLIYTQEEWKNFEQKLEVLKFLDEGHRKLRRFFLGGAAECVVDNQGRVLLSPAQRDFAGITKDAVIVCVGDHAEVWSKEKWDEKNNVSVDDINDLIKDIGAIF